jgi:hypothetical protein
VTYFNSTPSATSGEHNAAHATSFGDQHFTFGKTANFRNSASSKFQLLPKLHQDPHAIPDPFSSRKSPPKQPTAVPYPFTRTLRDTASYF